MLERSTPQPHESEHPPAQVLLAALALESDESEKVNAIQRLENELRQAGFERAKDGEVSEMLSDPSLLCRSESFTSIEKTLIANDSIRVHSDNEANVCPTNGGVGLRTAMLEGFSGPDVGNAVKVVVSFRPEHFKSVPLPKDHPLWQLKPATARNSLIGSGDITLEDIEMLSFRFSRRIFPESLLTDEETERTGPGGQFVFRHFKRKTSTRH